MILGRRSLVVFPLDPPATAAELAWFRAHRRTLIRKELLKAVGLATALGAGFVLSPFLTINHGGSIRVGFAALGALTIVGVTFISIKTSSDWSKAILIKRLTNESERKQQRFLEMLDSELAE